MVESPAIRMRGAVWREIERAVVVAVRVRRVVKRVFKVDGDMS